jgi:hypothetical protein
MTFKMMMIRFSILVGFSLLPISTQAQAVNTTAYAAGQESVQICLPTTGSYTPEVCEDNFDPVGLCEEGEVVELDHCSTYKDAPLCSKNGQKGQDCVCYYFCKKPTITPNPKDQTNTTLLNDYGLITLDGAGRVDGDSSPDALFAYSHTNSRGQAYYLHSKDVSPTGTGGSQTIYYFAKEIEVGALANIIPAEKTIVENERTGLLFLKGK